MTETKARGKTSSGWPSSRCSDGRQRDGACADDRQHEQLASGVTRPGQLSRLTVVPSDKYPVLLSLAVCIVRVLSRETTTNNTTERSVPVQNVRKHCKTSHHREHGATTWRSTTQHREHRATSQQHDTSLGEEW